MLDELTGKGLLIHHWDTDGICSARLLLAYLSSKKIVNKTPELGNYFLTPQELEQYSQYDFVLVVDMALPEENIRRLADSGSVLIFDHHLQREIPRVFHNNPVIKGKNPDEYPSASWIVNQYLKNSMNLFAILGVIGDHEQKIQKNKRFYQIVNDFCQDKNITFEDLLQMVYLLDSNYKLGKKGAVEQAPRFLLTITSSDEILHHPQWNENLSRLNTEITRLLEQPAEEKNGIILKMIQTPYNIISTITRKIAWESDKNTIVINTGYFNDKDQIYVRSTRNIEPMIQRGREHGFKCGGKKEVLGAIVPKEDTDVFIEELLYFFKKGGK